jgi:hypothetical protein
MRTGRRLGARFLGGFLIGCAQLLGSSAFAVPVTWIGGSGIWSDGDANNANWNPADEPDIDDEAIFNTADSVNLGTANTVQALTMSGGIDLTGNGHGLTVDGLVQLVDPGTTLIVEGVGSAVIADGITVNNGGQIRLNGLLSISEENGDGLLDVNAGGTISGSGTISLGDFVDAETTLLVNDGTISALAPAPFLGVPPPIRSLTINASDVTGGVVDLDGASGNGVLNAFRNQTLDVNVPLTKQFSGDINLFQNSTLDISNDWILDSGTIDVDSGAVDNPIPTPDVPAGVAHIRGGGLTQTGGTITVVDADGTLQFSAPFTMNGGNLVNNGLVVFGANASIAAGANFSMPTNSSSITVLAGVTVSIDQANFDADGAGSATNVITIGNGSILDLDLGIGADESLSGSLQLNGGELDVTTADADWSIPGTVNVGADTGTSQINGHEVTMSTASIVVGENSMLRINAATVWGASGSLAINAGGTATLTGITTFNGAGSFTGAGTLLVAGITTFDAPTTIDMPAGTVDLDGNDVIGSVVTIDADTTINVGTMADFGNNNVVGFNILQLNDLASLTVNLSELNAEWTLTADGRLDINASTTMAEGSGIRGSDFNMAGTATVDGNSLWTARTDISGTLTIAAGSRLTLGGGTRTDINWLLGGTINGQGALGAGNVAALHGFGSIHADIDFDGDSELFAHEGHLILSGDVLDARLLGTADGDAILDVTNPWNTGVVTQVVLQGGELRGATITNDNLIRAAAGDTLVTARVINDLQIFADGGNLSFQTASNDNDWDGTANNGQLNAFAGNITLHDNATFPYQGTIFIGNGHEVYTVGFSLELEPGSLLDLTGGTLRQSVVGITSARIGGEVVVNAGPESTLKTDGVVVGWVLEPTSEVKLSGNLRLDNGFTGILAGATFSGEGRLINLPFRSLSLSDGADVGVIVENRGFYSNSGTGPPGRNDMLEFVQTAAGSYRIDLEGTSTSQYDRLIVDGAAQLDGDLQLSLRGGYAPAPGDLFDIISAGGGITGTFANVMQPPLMPAGLFFDVLYSPTLVQLMVVEQVLLPGDYNLNGVVDAADYALWRDTLGQMGQDLAADGNGDGSIDAADYDVWRIHFGNMANSGASFAKLVRVPEPTSAVMLIMVICSLGSASRCRH